MSIVGVVLTYILYFYLVLVIGRFIFELLQSFSRTWRPSGPLVPIAEIIYTVTDPPLKFLRRLLPPIRLGSLGALDLSFIVLLLGISLLLTVAGYL